MQIIKTLKLKNFRNCGNDTRVFNFNPQFTVIIGINGKGKSTILQGLRIAAGAYLLGIPEAESKHIEYDEIHREVGKYASLKTPVIVEAIGSFLKNGTEMTWRRQIPLNKIKTTSNNEDVGAIRTLGATNYAAIHNGNKEVIDLPVIAFLGTSRLSGAGKDTFKKYPRIVREIFKEGYSNWKELKSTTFQYARWLGSYDILLDEGREMSGTKEAFFKAIKAANPYIEALRFQDGELWLKLVIEGETQDYLPLSLCSDGINSFTGMVAELAFRCIVLNAHHQENAVIESHGLILIDELDLHLHPNWQRHVVADLKNAFPNLQFVVTTHSPFIVQSLKANELINLDENTDIEPYKQSLEEVSEHIMQVKNAQKSILQQNMIDTATHYFELLNSIENTKNEDECTKIKEKLDNLLIPFYENAAFVAFLELEKLAKLGK